MQRTIDVLDPHRYEAGDPASNGLPHDQYEYLRAEAPVARVEIHDPALVDWCWVVSRYRDVVAIDRDPKHFVSTRGVTLREFEPTLVECGGKPSMITMDGADHVRNRRVVARGFSPAVVRTFEQKYRAVAAEIVERAIALGEFDFVKEVACELPLRAICDLMGVPPEERDDFFRWSNTFSVPTDPDYSPTPEDMFAAVHAIWGYGLQLAERRRREPGDDLMSNIVAALETERLDEEELMGTTLLLAGAGNETTRNNISHGLHGLIRHPEQMELLRTDTAAVIDSAVEEITRWASPVIGFRRTAAEDFVLHGQHIGAGERVTILYASANFDPEVFPDPYDFDLTRTPNPHVSYGTGPHLCLGAAVARLETRILFEELLARTSRIDLVGPIAYNRDSMLRGVKSLPVRVAPA